MMLGRADFKRLRLPLAAALVLLAIGAAALLMSERYLAEARKQQQAARAQLSAAKERFVRVAEEEREIRDNLVHFRRMADRGMVGAEKRLEWIEAIAATRTRRHLFEVRYKVEPQRPVDYPGISQNVKGPGAVFMASRVKLDIQLLHEEDLLNFLADLNAAGNSYLSARDCELARIEGGGPSGGPLRARLRASCVIDFITLKSSGTQ